MDIKELGKHIADADEDILQDIIIEWLKDHEDFSRYVESKLCPAVEDIDFGFELSRKTSKETKEFFHRNAYTREATDWSNVYYDLIEPWGEQAESFPTEKLYELVTKIITEVGMTVTEEDFYGDDWYGDDFSGSIDDIMETLGNIAGLLLVREDASDEMFSSLEKLVIKAKKTDVIDGYIGGVPYDDILDLIKLRREAEEVTSGMYDVMIEANYDRKEGTWLCRKIDFVRSMGMQDEAQEIMNDNLDFPDVCLKKYKELTEIGDWKAAVSLLDDAQNRKENRTMRDSFKSPNWLEMKQTLLLEHGTKDEQIENLRHLFHDSYGEESKMKYYDQLKTMISDEDWKDFYHQLLSEEKGYETLSTIAPFLIKEGEIEWMQRLVSSAESKDATDYRTPLRYAAVLSSEFHKEIAAQLVRTFRAYAADRFRPKRQVKTGKYSYFRADLEKLIESGYAQELKDLVDYFLIEYKFRPSLVRELKTIKLPQ